MSARVQTSNPRVNEREFVFEERDFRFLVQLVAEQTGIVLTAQKQDMVYSRLARRLRALNLTRFRDYCALMQSPEGKNEMGHLINAITTNLTSFFREAHHFEHLKSEVLAPLADAPPPEKRLRLWSAACSSGMEPYSIAMVLRSAIPQVQEWNAKILATDIDTGMITTASKGSYPSSEWKNIPTGYRDQVTRDAKSVHMPPELRSLITFKPLNLLTNWPMRGLFDAIFCRNVVIYFDKPTQCRLFDRLADQLVPGGWLYIGHSENLTHVSDRYELCGRTIYRRVR